ncbi:hypothetical protein DQ237_13640 [Blastococcus sp. TF02-8]|uniref:hypothetical protein n=1 Tax=Blastococcus sp. TF02-8 TaxID=2250574 RepID=UPI000DE8950F|nr:hypothetical protein [Blastococcus sp. TF02-8]RBY95565.1 hypothetical protein DQ237_13640 [Blastococcus sp. TF02-8]
MTSGAEWLDQARRLLDAVREPAPGGEESDCRWCPVCQAAAVLRGERPEVSAALADLLGTAASALREFAADVAAAQPQAGEAPPPPAEAPPVQRIDIA